MWGSKKTLRRIWVRAVEAAIHLKHPGLPFGSLRFPSAALWYTNSYSSHKIWQNLATCHSSHGHSRIQLQSGPAYQPVSLSNQRWHNCMIQHDPACTDWVDLESSSGLINIDKPNRDTLTKVIQSWTNMEYWRGEHRVPGPVIQLFPQGSRWLHHQLRSHVAWKGDVIDGCCDLLEYQNNNQSFYDYALHTDLRRNYYGSYWIILKILKYIKIIVCNRVNIFETHTGISLGCFCVQGLKQNKQQLAGIVPVFSVCACICSAKTASIIPGW